MASIDLTLQPALAPDQLTAFLVSPAGNEVFTVTVPPDLAHRHQLWLRRFMAHHDPALPALPAAVLQDYGNKLGAAMNAWLQQSDWEPLRRVLARLPALPLRLRCQGTPELIERLPWEVLELELERPIWRLGDPGHFPSAAHARCGVRSPRLLLLVGREEGLDLEADIAELQRLDRQGRIALHTLRGPDSCLSRLRAALGDKRGWDVLVFLGHSAGDPQGGGRLQLGDGHWLGGNALAQEFQQAKGHGLSLVLLNSCSGMDLAHCCTAAGIPWALCFREAVPTTAASLAFSQLLGAMEHGRSFPAALQHTRQALQESGPAGCHLLLSGMCAGGAPELHLPLSARRRFRLRLASSTRRQAIAALALLAAAATAELLPANPLSTYLLDRRLYVQRLWREATGQPGPLSPSLPVLLLDERRAYKELQVEATPGRVARAALAEVLRRTPPGAVPVVGLDVVLDEPAPHTAELAAVIRRQRRQQVLAGWLGAGAGARAAGVRSQPLEELRQAGLHARDLGVGTTAGQADRQPMPLQLLWEVNSRNFASALSAAPQVRMPPEAVIDWSIDWTPLVRPIGVAELSELRAPALVVGTDGTIDRDQSDLFHAPAAIRPALAVWGGPSDVIPGALVQAVLAQSLALRHWLTPVSLSGCTALAAGLGVLTAAALPERRHRGVALGAAALLTIPLSLQLATARLVLVPIVLPVAALSATSLLRRD
ncbi:CHAT domain-containing protein [Cyanobium sp. CH-040]|uniref:CHAT domain-containing protein n=1 Tax=Cyanobium sp. CH-040 TaxID=2823708 RepID=UPI0020CE0D3A|nr:CHAT domain-containing protein [Cyanobium sp. CH-040]MCP9928834.1 CHAT domain-containing protein [Cyanobium sp. CH-040]